MLALLEILEGGGIHTARELAERLDVDERTVRRYIDHLVDLDVPVWTERGGYGGYCLAPGFRMPPMMLTNDEALAVLLGLVAGRLAGLLTTSAAAADAATAKLRRVLPAALGRRLDALLVSVDFTAAAAHTTSPDTEVLLVLAEATRDRRPVAVATRAEMVVAPRAPCTPTASSCTPVAGTSSARTRSAGRFGTSGWTGSRPRRFSPVRSRCPRGSNPRNGC